MKKWTIVIEITDRAEDYDNMPYNHSRLEENISDALEGELEINSSFQIMEIIEAPYGPQHKDGVFLDTRHGAGSFSKKVRP